LIIFADQGNLTVTPLKANNLPAADRSGTSDPYVVFLLNGQKIKKTEVYKKNINPVFSKDELFVVPIASRTAASLRIEVFDWDQIGKDTLLGTGEIPLAGNNVESFGSRDIEVPITGMSANNSTIRVRLMWQPQLLAKKKTRTGFLGASTRAFTSAPTTAFGASRTIVGGGANLAGDAFGAGGKVISGGANVLGGGVNALGSGLKSGMGFLGGKQKTKTQDLQPPASTQPPTPTVPAPSAPSASPPAGRSSGDDSASLSSLTTPIMSRSTGSLGKKAFYFLRFVKLKAGND
jgi:Ca2+-dependent lipid-binding protein